jgi:hypothetical protein
LSSRIGLILSQSSCIKVIVKKKLCISTRLEA